MNELDLLYSPFKRSGRNILIPKKYVEQVGEYKVPATEEGWLNLRDRLIASYWMNYWYDSSLPTPLTDFYTIEQFGDLNCQFAQPKFIRLNSLSPKIYTPFYNSSTAIGSIMQSGRCCDSIDFANGIGEEILVALRDFVALNRGNEYRVFIFEDQIKAICSNDNKIASLPKNIIIDRITQLYKKVRWHIPSPDCVMDVWLSDQFPEKDILIEFNSFGFWGQSSAGLYDWHADWNILYNPNPAEIDIRLLNDM